MLRIGDEDVLTTLMPFFEHNPHLGIFELGSPKKGVSVDRDITAALANALGKSRTISKFSLYHKRGSNLFNGTTGWSALSSSISSLKTSLREIVLSNCVRKESVEDDPNLPNNTTIQDSLERDGSTEMALSIGRCSNLTSLSLQHALVPNKFGKCHFFNMMKSFRSLTYCCLERFNLNDGDIPGMVESLGSIISLRHLRLCDNTNVTTEGWQQFSRILQNPNCRLENLQLVYFGTPISSSQSNRIDDDAVTTFANILANNTFLKVLQVGMFTHHDTFITERGWAALANVL